MKKILSLIFFLLLSTAIQLTACAAETDYTNGNPWPAIDLDGVVKEDTPVNLKDNFDLAVNKDKILKLKFAEGYNSAGTTTALNQQQSANLTQLFKGEAPKEHDAKLAYDLYNLLMDWDSRNAQGTAPLKKAVDTIEAVDSIPALNKYILETPAAQQPASLWLSGSDSDIIDSTRNVLIVTNSGLLLDDSAEYTNLTEYGIIKKDAISTLSDKMLQKLGYSKAEADKKLANCLALEKMMSSAIYTNEEQQQAEHLSRINNRYTYEQLAKEQGNVPILAFIAHMGYPKADEYLIPSPKFITKLNELYTEENLPLLKDYLIVHAATSSAQYLDQECYDLYYDYSNAVTGSKGKRPDDESFAKYVSSALKWQTAELYTEKYLKQADKDRISALIDKILAEYHGVIESNDFLSEQTKAKAIEKLDAIQKNVLFPDSWEKYEDKDLNFTAAEDGGTLWQALTDIDTYLLAKNVKEYNQPVDKEKWIDTPQTVNCFYNPANNSIYIMGAFAQGSVYNSEMSDEELLAKLGWVIGHEISHAFDSTGAQFDKDGNMNNWWTEEDYAAFRERNDKMIAYFDKMHPWQGQNFYGSIMTGEAGADMSGLKVVLKLAEKDPDFDYDKFFRSVADMWLTKNTLQRVYMMINDVHPMGYLRINCTLQQFDKFLDFYGITKGDGMYLAPEDRVIIW